MISRDAVAQIQKRIDYKKAIILFGPRQTGKTTLSKSIAEKITTDYEYYNGDELTTQNLWSAQNIENLITSFTPKKVIIIDEVQRIENIGLLCKQIIDANLGVQLIITGSSSLNIANLAQEPLTGRKWEYLLYPISCSELLRHWGLNKLLKQLQQILIYGSYPDVVMHPKDAKELISNITTSYLYKDILALTGIKKPMLLQKILQALAWQLGNEVSLNELAALVQADVKTVDNYIYLLEQVFVVYRVSVLSRNHRNEINTKKKIYFYDNGIRNAIIGNFSFLTARNDVGALWENYLFVERKKLLQYNGFHGHTYFWRNKLNAEVDYIEEIDGKIYAFEFNWNPNAKVKFPKAFIENYAPTETKVIHPTNYWEWLTKYPY
jgi:uncharacterized protein